MSAPRARAYRGERITVSFEARRCIHVGACLRGMPAVFETGRKPWIVVGDADAAEVAAVVERCPSGALTYERHDGGPAEVAVAPTRIERGARGPLHVRGDVVVRAADGEVRLTRATLCACGRTSNPPFCDLSHRAG